MEEEDRKELQDAIIQGEQAIANDNQVAGRQATFALHHQLLGSGIASQLFLAERAIIGAPEELTKELALTVAGIREAFDMKDADKISMLRDRLRSKLAELMRQRASIKGVEDKQDLQDLLRFKEQ